jgi:ATP-dependent protease ClpP protease subunit
MPYYSKKVGDKWCVFKKDDNSKVGCVSSKEKLKPYLAALHMNEPENKLNPFKYIQNFSEDKKEVTLLMYDTIGDVPDENGNVVPGICGAEFASTLQYLEDCGCETVHIRINSPGGSVIEGWSIISAIKNSKMEIHTYNDGLAASTAGVIFCCGDYRCAMDYSITMLHNPSGLDEKDVLSKVKESLITILKNNSYISDELLDELMNEETYLNAEETLEAGLCDLIIDSGEKIEEDVDNMDLYEIANTFNKIINKMKKKTLTAAELKLAKNKAEKEKMAKDKLGVESPETLANKKKSAKDDDEETEAVDEEGLMNEAPLTGEDAPDQGDSDEDQDGDKGNDEDAEDDMKDAYNDLMEKHKKLMADHEDMTAERDELKGKLDKMKDEVKKEHKKKIDAMVNELFIGGKIGKSEIDSVTALAEKDFESVKNLFSKIGITKNVTFKSVINEKVSTGIEPGVTIRDLEKKDPKKLMEIKNNMPAVYAQMYKEFYGVEPKK